MENVPIHHSALSPKTHIQPPRETILKPRALSPLNTKNSYDCSLGDTSPATASHFHPSQLESPPRHATQEAISTSLDASQSYLESYIVSSLDPPPEDSSIHLEMAQSESVSGPPKLTWHRTLLGTLPHVKTPLVVSVLTKAFSTNWRIKWNRLTACYP